MHTFSTRHRTDQDVDDGFRLLLNAVERIEQAQLLLHTLAPTIEQLKAVRPDWREQDDDVSILIRRFDRLRANASAPRLLDINEVAARVPGGVKPNGKPQDSIYDLARQLGTKIGGKWLVSEDILDSHMRGR